MKPSTTATPGAGRAVTAAMYDRAPLLAAFVAFLFGALALLAGVTAVSPPIPGLGALEAMADEWPQFTASIAGVVLMSLALGLRRRLDTAWAGAAALLAFLSVYAFVRHGHAAAGAACLAGFALLLGTRRAFYRHAGLAALFPSRPLYLAIAAAIACAVMGAILWAAERPGFAIAPWWTLLTDAHIGRAGRAAAVAALGLGAIVLWSALLSPAKKNPSAPGPDDAARVESLIARAEAVRPEAHPKQAETAAHLDLSDRSIREWEVKLNLQAVPYTLTDIRIAYIRSLREGAAGRETVGDLDLAGERAALAKARGEHEAVVGATEGHARLGHQRLEAGEALEGPQVEHLVEQEGEGPA